MPDLAERQQQEQALAAALLLLVTEWQARVARGGSLEWDLLHSQIRQALGRSLPATYLAAADQLAVLRRIQANRGVVAAESRQWGERQAAAIADAVLAEIRAAAEQAQTTLEVAAVVAAAMSAGRLTSIAITEITRAITAGEFRITGMADALDDSLIETDIDLDALPSPTWHTEADGRVCPVCAPLHEQPPEIWMLVAPEGPPAHPRCRCWLEWETEI